MPAATAAAASAQTLIPLPPFKISPAHTTSCCSMAAHTSIPLSQHCHTHTHRSACSPSATTLMWCVTWAASGSLMHSGLSWSTAGEAVWATCCRCCGGCVQRAWAAVSGRALWAPIPSWWHLLTAACWLRLLRMDDEGACVCVSTPQGHVFDVAAETAEAKLHGGQTLNELLFWAVLCRAAAAAGQGCWVAGGADRLHLC